LPILAPANLYSGILRAEGKIAKNTANNDLLAPSSKDSSCDRFN
jgi:hypothetical protein